jgi:adenylate cyclase
MAREIEHKFVVDTRLWKPRSPGVRIEQGYLSAEMERVVRVRLLGDRATITTKGQSRGLARDEFEYEIPAADARYMLREMCLKPILSKTRYHETIGGLAWEVDVFHAENEGLVIAEVEVHDEAQAIETPVWAVREVSSDSRYFNSSLALRPYNTWAASLR